MAATLSQNDDALLQIAIDLLIRSDTYAEAEPRIARQYARQAYELGQHSQELRRSIANERIWMIVQRCSRRRIANSRSLLPQSRVAWLRHIRSTVVLLLFLAASLVISTPVSEIPDQQLTQTARLVNAPL